MSRLRSALSGRTAGLVLVACMAASAAVAAPNAAAAAAPPALNVSPHGNYSDGQTISVGVGPNSYFTPHRRVNVIECADPGGSAAHLPTDITTCDGNTIQGGSVLVGNDGSFSLSGYPVYLLPSPTLGEQPNFTPICNQTNYCVLYVGQDQNDFTAPKVFSSPFLITPSASGSATTGSGAGATSSSPTSSAAAGPTTGTTAPATSPAGASGSTANPSTALTVTPAALANTGAPSHILWVGALALALLLTGATGRRLAVRRAR